MNKTRQIRELAKQVAELAYSDANYRKREMWELHNQMRWEGPPPVMVSLDKAWREVLPADCLGAYDYVYRLVETDLRKRLWYASLGDDRVVEPFVEMTAQYYDDAISMWGVEMQFSEIGDSTVFNGEIENPSDVDRMHVPTLRMDGTRTMEYLDRANELLDGILPVRMEWRHKYMIFPNIGVWTTQFFGLERFMLWCIDYPEAVKKFMGIMTQTYVQHNLEAERRHKLTDNNCLKSALGDFPWHMKPAQAPRLSDMWTHSAAEEFQLISPEMTEEFLLSFIRPVFAMFGHTSYGCCESQNNKLEFVKTLPKLRRVIISERTDWEYARKTLGTDFVYVVRPCTVDTLFVDDEAAMRKHLKRMCDVFRGTSWEIMHGGIETFNGDLERCHKWVRIAKETVDGV